MNKKSKVVLFFNHFAFSFIERNVMLRFLCVGLLFQASFLWAQSENCAKISYEEFVKSSDDDLEYLVGKFTWTPPTLIEAKFGLDAEVAAVNEKLTQVARFRGFQKACSLHVNKVIERHKKRIEDNKLLVSDFNTFYSATFDKEFHKKHDVLKSENKETMNLIEKERKWREEFSKSLIPLKEKALQEYKNVKDLKKLSPSFKEELKNKLAKIDTSAVCRKSSLPLESQVEKARKARDDLYTHVDYAYMEQRNRLIRQEFIKSKTYIYVKENCYYELDKYVEVEAAANHLKPFQLRYANTTCVSKQEAQKGSWIDYSLQDMNLALAMAKASWDNFDEEVGSMTNSLKGDLEKHRKQYSDLQKVIYAVEYPYDLVELAENQCQQVEDLTNVSHMLEMAQGYIDGMAKWEDLEKKSKDISSHIMQRAEEIIFKDKILSEVRKFSAEISNFSYNNKYEKDSFIKNQYKYFLSSKNLKEHFSSEIRTGITLSDSFYESLLPEIKNILNPPYEEWNKLTEQGGLYLAAARSRRLNTQLKAFERLVSFHPQGEVFIREWARSTQGYPLFLNKEHTKVFQGFRETSSSEKPAGMVSTGISLSYEEIHAKLSSLEETLKLFQEKLK